MKNERRGKGDPALRRALQEADAAKGVAPLDPVEVARMRRAVLAAADATAPRRSRAVVWIPATAVLVAAIALVAWLMGGPVGQHSVDSAQSIASTSPERPKAGSPPRSDLAPGASSQSESQSESQSGSQSGKESRESRESRKPEPTNPPARMLQPGQPGPTLAAAKRPEHADQHSDQQSQTGPHGKSSSIPPLAVEAIARSAKMPRTLRFVTQSGTQIIWTLDPDLEL